MHRVGAQTLLVLAALTLASCGGDEGEATPTTTSPAAEVNEDEIGQAFETIIDKCIDISFGQGGSGAQSAVSSAVDDLIRNYNIDPDAPIDAGGLKAGTPREALEGSLSFLEKQGCSPADGQRVHEALAAVPETDPGDTETTEATTTEATTPPDVEEQVRNVVTGYQQAVIERNDEVTCGLLTPLQRQGQTFGGECPINSFYRGMDHFANEEIENIQTLRDGEVEVTFANRDSLKMQLVEGVYLINTIDSG
jgi:hypothetical protein